MRRVAITGVGVVTPLGRDWETFASNVRNGVCAIQRRTYHLEGFEGLTVPVAPVVDFDAKRDLPNCKVRSWDRLSHFALYAAREAVKDAGVAGTDIDALTLGSSTTSVETLDENYVRLLRGNGRISPMMIAKSMPNAPVSAVSMDLRITGASYAISSACSSANHALIAAASAIRSGEANLALAGGVEASLSFTNLSAWKAMNVLSDDTCRPFCATRSGLVIGEGAGLFVLEELEHAKARGAHIWAELKGWGQSSDAKSLTTPDQPGVELALSRTLQHSGLQPNDIDYINAHGTGTELNDVMEGGAIAAVFGSDAKDIKVSSTKGMHGHLLGAAGAIELSATLAGMSNGFVPGNLGLSEQDAAIVLNTVGENEKGSIQNAICASFAFGGHNSVIALQAPA